MMNDEWGTRTRAPKRVYHSSVIIPHSSLDLPKSANRNAMSTPPPGYSDPYANNPYAPPKVAAPFPVQQPPFPVGDPLFGLFRQGNVLVMHKLAPLPDKCIKSNQPAHGRTLRRNLRWHHPAAFFALLV